jgi:hypothetical protein
MGEEAIKKECRIHVEGWRKMKLIRSCEKEILSFFSNEYSVVEIKLL